MGRGPEPVLHCPLSQGLANSFMYGFSSLLFILIYQAYVNIAIISQEATQA